MNKKSRSRIIKNLTEFYLNNGFGVVPIAKGKKNPILKNWEVNYFKTVDDYHNWLGDKYATHNVGLVTGKETGILVIDIDKAKDESKTDGEESLKLLIEELGELPHTVEQRTRSGARQLFFKYPKNVDHITGQVSIVDCIDIRADGNQVVVEPSIYIDENGNQTGRWQWINRPENTPLAELPESWLNFILAKNTQPEKNKNELEVFNEGKRNNGLFKTLCKYVRNPEFRNFDDLYTLALAINQTRCNPPLDLSEVETIVNSVINKYASPSSLTKTGDIDRFTLMNEENEIKLEKNLNNYKILVEELGYIVAKNVINKTIIAENKNVEFPQGFSLDNKINYIKQDLGEKYNFRINQTEAFVLFDQLANSNLLNPVTNFLEDNYQTITTREGAIEELASKLITPDDYDDETKLLFIKSWMINAVKVFYNTLEKATPLEGVLTLQGEQGTYKTRFTQAIVPSPLKQYYKSGVSVDPTNRDSKSQTLSYAFVELGEVDSIMKKTEQSLIKQFITETKDVWRAPYDKYPNEYPRNTVFTATVNPEEFLKDDKNRRWYVIPIKQILIDEVTDELVCRAWAEAYQLAIIENQSHIVDPCIINEVSEHFRIKSNRECVIDQYFDWNEPKDRWRFWTCQELAELFNLQTTRGLTAMIRNINPEIEMKQKKINKKVYKGYLLPSNEDPEVNKFFEDIIESNRK